MITMLDVLQKLDNQPDRITLEEYILHEWIRPIRQQEEFYFEDIDITRIKLVHQLRHDMLVGDEAMDIVLHLLDQLYCMREQISRLKQQAENPDS